MVSDYVTDLSGSVTSAYLRRPGGIMGKMSTMAALHSGFALYMRVSTGRQAEKQLSLPDQRLQLCDVVVRLGGVVVDEFTDTKSGTTSNRPELQRLEAIVDSGAATFQTVLVHSFSRLFRNVGEAEVFVQKLRKRGIEIVSITQPLPAGPAGDLMRAILMGFSISRRRPASMSSGRCGRTHGRASGAAEHRPTATRPTRPARAGTRSRRSLR